MGPALIQASKYVDDAKYHFTRANYQTWKTEYPYSSTLYPTYQKAFTQIQYGWNFGRPSAEQNHSKP